MARKSDEFSLDSSVSEIKGVGGKRLLLLNRLGIYTVGELITYLPRTYKDRRNITSVNNLLINQVNTIKCIVVTVSENTRAGSKIISKVTVSDDTGQIDIVWFNQPYMKNLFKKGTQWIFTGKVLSRFNRLTMECEEYEEADDKQLLSGGRIVPVYSSTYKLHQKFLRSIIKLALDVVFSGKTCIPDLLPQEILERYKLCPYEFAIKNIHFPEDDDSFFAARRRLVFEELFLMQAALMSRKGYVKSCLTAAFSDLDYSPLKNIFPFELTEAQQRVIDEMLNEVNKGIGMNRLIQGDVGSGKTAVAQVMCYLAIKNGGQAAIMAPTEILAKQHFEAFNKLFSGMGIKTELLSGSLKKSQKQAAYNDIESGLCQMIVGTHAVIQDKVSFQNLLLIVTDEQHRFGVKQRCFLNEKGPNPHVLVMSATPIPRTLGLVIYRDMDVSVIDKLPPGRQKIETYHVTTDYRPRIYVFIEKQVTEGRQAYVICPTIMQKDDSDTKPLQSVIEYTTRLKRFIKKCRVECLHGKMPPEEKRVIMEKFAAGEIDVIVSTTVIEVGINVPNATVMVIEDADRFGLSQLHQLRGRVGRGSEKSYCILITDSASKACAKRMKVMSETDDGFAIAEMDLRLRGSGDFFGTRQHGLPEMKIANLYEDTDILAEAGCAAEENLDKIMNIDYKPPVKEYFLLKERIESYFAVDYSDTL